MKLGMRVIAALVLYFLISPSTQAASDFGLGVILGEPTGLSGRLEQSSQHAFDGALAWSLGDNDYIHVHFDYLWLRPNALQVDGEPLELFYGIGARLKNHNRDRGRGNDDDDDDDDDRTRLGVRAPIGLAYRFKNPSLQIFGELALILDLIESTDLDLNGGLGIRYYF